MFYLFIHNINSNSIYCFLYEIFIPGSLTHEHCFESGLLYTVLKLAEVQLNWVVLTLIYWRIHIMDAFFIHKRFGIFACMDPKLVHKKKPSFTSHLLLELLKVQTKLFSINTFVKESIMDHAHIITDSTNKSFGFYLKVKLVQRKVFLFGTPFMLLKGGS